MVDRFFALSLLICTSFLAYSTEYHVAQKGSDVNIGTINKPFRTINHAAQIAMPGDTVTVHAGVYREWVNPQNGGTSDDRRILYRAAPGEKVEIKGSEIVTGWKQQKNGIWKVVIPNHFFNGYNSCNDLVQGDWCDNFSKVHTADLFYNGKSLFEMDSLEKVIHPSAFERTKDKEGSLHTWYCEVDSATTTIWANFQGGNPNKSVTELSIRRTCFYPDKPWVNYITIRGFEISQAASQWAAPTAEQIGMVATHWNKGWIIEDNIIHDSKASGITLGKERSTGHNVWSNDPSYDGALHYIEVIFRVLRKGWSKENIGSHIVRNNIIYNCEQAGICGSFGAAFSRFEHNHIYQIHQKKQFTGAEMGGIKLHAAVDVVLVHNRIHDSGAFGFWLDWLAQGTRVSKNLLYRNDWNDMFFEVDHGPYLVDNNIMLSSQSLRNQSEGGAYVHNLIGGSVGILTEPNRYTPYLLPHATDVAGLSTVLGGDDRYYNNIFVIQDQLRDQKGVYGISSYLKKTDFRGPSHTRWPSDRWPVAIDHNAYYNGVSPHPDEKDFVEESNFNPNYQIIENSNDVYLQFSTDASLSRLSTPYITSGFLGEVKLPKEGYTHPDGTALQIDTDFLGKKRDTVQPTAGPFEKPAPGIIRIKVW